MVYILYMVNEYLHGNHKYFLEPANPIYFQIPEGFKISERKSDKDVDRLFFPNEIAEEIGLCVNEITFLKRKGCPFHGRKTTIRWVRSFLARNTGAIY